MAHAPKRRARRKTKIHFRAVMRLSFLSGEEGEEKEGDVTIDCAIATINPKNVMTKRTTYSPRPVTRPGTSDAFITIPNWSVMVMFSDVKHAAAASSGGAVVVLESLALGTPVGKRELSRSANMTPARLNTMKIRMTLMGPRSLLEK